MDNLFRDLTQKVLDKIEKGEIPTDGVNFCLLRQLVLRRAMQPEIPS